MRGSKFAIVRFYNVSSEGTPRYRNPTLCQSEHPAKKVEPGCCCSLQLEVMALKVFLVTNFRRNQGLICHESEGLLV